jgi:hypothetical protein
MSIRRPIGLPLSTRRPAGWLRLLVVVLACLLLSGCVYLRLLQLKNQFAQFDKYFEADTRDGLKLTFKEPVLLDQDLEEFFKWVPESRQKAGKVEKWHFRWLKEKVAADGAHVPYAVELDLIFVDHKLAKLIAPESFFAAVMPKQFVLTSLKALGGAKVDQKNRSATVSAESKETKSVPTERPSQAGLKVLLGEPVEIAGGVDAPEWTYRFAAATPSQRLGSGSIEVRFTFNPKTGVVRKMKGATLGMSVAMDFGESESAANADGAATTDAEKR